MTQKLGNLNDLQSRSLYPILVVVSGLIASVSFHSSFNQTENYQLLIYQLISLTCFFSSLFYIAFLAFTKQENKNPIYWFVFCYGSFVLYWLPQGFDLTDEGRILLIAKHLKGSVLNNYVFERFGTVALSYFWNSVVNFEYILWSRMSYVVLSTLTGIFAYKFLSLFIKHRALLLFTIVGMVVYNIFPIYTINYNSTPILFLIASLFFAYRKDGHSIFNFSISVLLLLISVSCNISFLVFIPFYLIGILLFQKENPVTIKQSILGIILGSVLFVSVLALVYFLIDFQSETGKLVNSLASDHLKKPSKEGAAVSHNLTILLEKYWFEVVYISPLIFQTLLIFIYGLFASIMSPKKGWLFITPGLIVLLLFIIDSPHYYWVEILSILSATIILTVLLVGLQKKYRIVLYWAILLFTCTFLGSNNGLTNIVYTGGVILIIPAALSLLSEVKFNFNLRKINTNSLAWGIGITLFILGLSWHSQKIYRDYPRNQIFTKFESKKLVGIYSAKNKVQEIDNYLIFLNNNLSFSDKVLSINTIPNLSFISDRTANVNISALGWLGINWERTDYKYVLLNSKNTRNPLWPSVNDTCAKPEIPIYKKHYEFLSNNYNIIYKGEALLLFEKN